MKKIIFSLVIIGVVGAIVGGATWAYFSDTAEVKNNVLAMGTVELGSTYNMPFEMENLAPGKTETADLAIQYDGSLLADLYIGAQERGWESDYDLGPILEYKIQRMDSDWEHDGWIVGGSGDNWHDFAEEKHLMNSWTKTHSDLENGDWARARLHIRIKTEPIDDSDINDYQGKSEGITVIFYAVQPEGEAPETLPRDW